MVIFRTSLPFVTLTGVLVLPVYEFRADTQFRSQPSWRWAGLLSRRGVGQLRRSPAMNAVSF